MITVCWMNCNTTHNRDFSIERPRGLDCYLFLIIKSPGYFLIDGKMTLVAPNNALIYSPGTPQHFRPACDRYSNDWMHFYADSNLIEESGVILNRPFPLTNCTQIVSIFRCMCEEFYSVKENKTKIIDHLASSIILMAGNSLSNNVKTPQFSKLIKLRQEIYHRPHLKWSVPEMAAKMNLSCGYLQSIYKDAFNISCNADVINARINCAKNLLNETEKNVKEISFECGYENDVHFLRQFKKFTGYTPSQYRKLNSSLTATR